MEWFGRFTTSENYVWERIQTDRWDRHAVLGLVTGVGSCTLQGSGERVTRTAKRSEA